MHIRTATEPSCRLHWSIVHTHLHVLEYVHKENYERPKIILITTQSCNKNNFWSFIVLLVYDRL